ncbi:hypothetical protein F2Q69_00047486 [Brassica cretica]|uniref:Uncharacterized protein n=1 Tax=Brassica cretica TaxID=69181 RepID=A0A8S9PJV3_BRACR|nr:hypothetical protein F2Q69_00047486 [Brassica cretica]
MTCVGRIEHSPENVWCAENFGFSCIARYGILVRLGISFRPSTAWTFWEVFYACDLRNFAGEELRSKLCAENLAVHSGMTSGLVELAVGITLELVPGPDISGSLSVFGVDSVIMLALEIFSLVVDIPVVTRVFPSRGCLLWVVVIGEDFLPS